MNKLFPDHLTMALWLLLGVALSAVAVAQSIIGENPLTCITFDQQGSIKASRGVYMSVFGVNKNSDGVYHNCGEFENPSRMQMPFFYGNDFFQLSISLWFKKKQNTRMLILSTGQCSGSSIYIKSIGNLALKVKVKTAIRSYIITANTLKQTANFVHVVVTFFASTSTGSGRMNVYIDGVHKGQKLTQGKILPLPGQMTLGSDSCPNPTKTNFKGCMDSVSFARTELSSTEVMDLYTSQGSCIGE